MKIDEILKERMLTDKEIDEILAKRNELPNVIVDTERMANSPVRKKDDSTT